MPETVKSIRFDRSLLPPADLEFVVVADTHYMMDVGGAPLEFESRRKQGRRAGVAWQAIGALEPEFIVHMGDMVQEFPGRPAYEQTISEALGQIDDAGVRSVCKFVVGNHDIGDRPDPTMPTGETTEDSLRSWESRFGPSWHTWDAAGIHFLVMNSQLLNTSMPEAAVQREWVEAQFARFGQEPCYLFLHMPPYLSNPSEPWLGHYDNLGEPDRAWVLDLVRNHNVQNMFAGHVHFQYFDHVVGNHSTCRYFVTPSTSFTRPGFSHLFTSAAPPEQGRDDVPKLGFFLCRVVDGRLDIHRFRFQNMTDAQGEALVATPVSSPAQPNVTFGLGVSLRHQLAPETEVPIAWPSVIRQPVRNDYPTLACMDLGVSWIRVPVSDLTNLAQARRLAILRDEGIRVQAVALGEQEAAQCVKVGLKGADRLEVQLPGRVTPDVDALRGVNAGIPLVLAPVLPGQKVPGKQHARTRIGFAVEELTELANALDGSGISPIVACRLDPGAPWEQVRQLRQARADQGWELQLLAELPGIDHAVNATAVARAIFAAAALNVHVLLEPLVDMDRTMDVNGGLLDSCCNPRITYETARTMTALTRRWTDPAAELEVVEGAGCEVITLGDMCLLIPGEDPTPISDVRPWKETGTVIRLTVGSVIADCETVSPATGPVLAIRHPA